LTFRSVGRDFHGRYRAGEGLGIAHRDRLGLDQYALCNGPRASVPRREAVRVRAGTLEVWNRRVRGPEDGGRRQRLTLVSAQLNAWPPPWNTESGVGGSS